MSGSYYPQGQTIMKPWDWIKNETGGNRLGELAVIWACGASLVAAIDYSDSDILSSIVIWAVFGFGALIAVMMPIYELIWEDGWDYTFIIWVPSIILGLIGNWDWGWYRQRNANKGGIPNRATTTGGYVPRAKGDVWDEYYDKLVALNGGGTITPQRIISKVQTNQELTEHERKLWNQVN